MPKVKPSELKYLALEGGGGKGVAYLGPIHVMEGLGLLPLNILGSMPHYDPSTRKITHDRTKGGSQILGISGSSAGAITALCLAMGMDAKEILAVLKQEKIYFDRWTSVFNTFFDAPGLEEMKGEGTWNQLAARLIMQGDQARTSHYYRTVEASDNPRGRNVPRKTRIFDSMDNRLTPDLALLSPAAQSGLRKWAVEKYLQPHQHVSVVNAMLGFPREGAELPPIAEPKVTYHLRNLLYGGGLFTGLTIRQFFCDLLRKHLFEKDAFNRTVVDRMYAYNQTAAGLAARRFVFEAAANQELMEEADGTPAHLDSLRYALKFEPGEITFRQFYYLTGVDLVITGTNITNGVPLYFSAARTPDFPVVEAVCLSMNLPVLFSPVHIRSDVYLDESDYNKLVQVRRGTTFAAYNAMYRGLYVDGGVLNNLPIHAFNSVEDPFSEFVDPRQRRKVYAFNKAVLALRLTDGFRAVRNNNDGAVRIADDLSFFSVLGNMINTSMYYSEVGQIRTQEEMDHVVHCYTHHLTVENFSAPGFQRDLPIMEAFLGAATYFEYYDLAEIPRFDRFYPRWEDFDTGVGAMVQTLNFSEALRNFQDNFAAVREDAYKQSDGFKMAPWDGGNSNTAMGLTSIFSQLYEALVDWE